jgi:hypothetical protein
LALGLILGGASLGGIGALLSDGSQYQRSILLQGLGGGFFFTAGLGVGAFAVLFLRRRTRSLVAVVIPTLVAVAFMAFGSVLAVNAGRDLLEGPAIEQGIVTDRHIEESSDEDGAAYSYVITLGPRSWFVSEDDYRRTTVGRCFVITYGPHTRHVTGVAPCATDAGG